MTRKERDMLVINTRNLTRIAKSLEIIADNIGRGGFYIAGTIETKEL